MCCSVRPPDILISRTGHPTSTPSFSSAAQMERCWPGPPHTSRGLWRRVVVCVWLRRIRAGGVCCGSPEPTPLPAVSARHTQTTARRPCPLVCGSGQAGVPLRGRAISPSLKGRGGAPSLREEGRWQGLVALPCGRHQVPEAGMVACPALLQATARRCRSAGVTTGRGEPPCCQPFLSHGEGEGHLRFKAQVA